MQIIPRSSGFGEELGTGLGTLAGIKLAGLVKRHEQERERANFAQQWEPLLGKSTANFLSNLSPEERKSALGNLEALTGAFQQPGEENGLGSIARPIKPQFGQQQVQEQQRLEEQFNPQKAKLAERIFESPKEKRDREKFEFDQRQANLKETKPYIDSLKAQEKAAKEGNLRLSRMEKLIDKGNLPNAGLWSLLSKVEESPGGSAGAGAIAGSALGSVFPGIGTAIGGIAGGLLGGMTSYLAGATKSLIKSGSPDIEEFEKLSNDFVKNAKQYFGSRITDADLRVFMQTIPTLMQTDAGKKKVIDNLRSLNELSEIESKAARSIIKAHNGIPPLDLEQQVKDKISDKIDKVAQEFIVR